MPRLLLISYRFPPETYPLANSLAGVVSNLQADWQIDVVTAAEGAVSTPRMTVHHVPPSGPRPIHDALKRARLDKLSHLLTWPDPFTGWVEPALDAAERLVRTHRHDVALTFMMPFSTGLVGMRLKERTGIPLVLNLDDSPTCSDMHPTYPSRHAYRQSRDLEDAFIRSADRVVYVSERNRDRVAERQPAPLRDRLTVVRCSAEPPADLPPRPAASDDVFRIVYTGAMTGWYDLDPTPPSVAKQMFHAWERLGQYRLTDLDRRSHSPVFVGRAIQIVLDRHPEWAGRIRLDVFGNTYPATITNRVLAAWDVADVVHLHRPIPPSEVPASVAASDLLFMALPDRVDGTPGGRISLKTYEYLLTDRPILAALPPGENREFLASEPGTYLTAPTDAAAMADVLESLVHERFRGNTLSVQRPGLSDRISSAARAEALSGVLHTVTRESRSATAHAA